MGLNWASRYSHLWPLMQIAQTGNRVNSQNTARLQSTYSQPLVDSVSDDFRRYRPQLVLVDRRIFAHFPQNYDILKTFVEDERFAALWRDYTRIGMAEIQPGDPQLEVYRRNAAPNPDGK